MKVTDALNQKGAPGAIMDVLETLPMSNVFIFLFVILAFVSLATSFDSVAYMLASITTKDVGKYIEPTRFQRVFWAFAITILPIALLFLGGLKTLQMSSVVGSLPLLIIVVLMIVSFSKDIKKEFSNEKIRKIIIENNVDSELITEVKKL